MCHLKLESVHSALSTIDNNIAGIIKNSAKKNKQPLTTKIQNYILVFQKSKMAIFLKKEKRKTNVISKTIRNKQVQSSLARAKIQQSTTL